MRFTGGVSTLMPLVQWAVLVASRAECLGQRPGEACCEALAAPRAQIVEAVTRMQSAFADLQ